jgi:hypothetical protein
MDAIVQAILDWLSKHFAQEEQVITSAPAAFIACVGLVGTAMFVVLRWHFKHELSARDSTIQIHEERHKLKDERMAHFLSQVERAAPDALPDQIEELRKQLGRRSIDAHTLDALSQLLAQSDELFDRAGEVNMDQYVAWETAWLADIDKWFQNAYDTIEKRLSKADAILFARLDLTQQTLMYRPYYSEAHNNAKCALANYQNNLKAIIERYS